MRLVVNFSQLLENEIHLSRSSSPRTLFVFLPCFIDILTPPAGGACSSSAGQTSTSTWVESARAPRKANPASAGKGRSSLSRCPTRPARAYIKICPCGSARSGLLGLSPSFSSVKSRVWASYASFMWSGRRFASSRCLSIQMTLRPRIWPSRYSNVGSLYSCR